MSVKIYSAPGAGAVYEFPVAGGLSAGWFGGMECMEESLIFRTEVSERRWSPGGVLTGDNLLNTRRIIVAGVLKGPSRAEMVMEINDMKNACYRPNHNWENGWLGVTPYDAAPYNQVYRITGVSRVDVEWITDVSAEITVMFEISDPFRYDRWTARYPATGMATRVLPFLGGGTAGTEWPIVLSAATAQVQLPIYYIRCFAGVVHTLILRNLSVRRPSWVTSGLRFEGLNLSVGEGLKIDTGEATVEKVNIDGNGVVSNPIDYIKKITSGDFPWLQPGTNTMKITLQNCPGDVGLNLYSVVRLRYL